MEIDDDFASFSPPSAPSPQFHHHRGLKRLKRAIKSPNNSPIKSNENPIDKIEDSIGLKPLDSHDLSENSQRSNPDPIPSPLLNLDSKTLDSDDDSEDFELPTLKELEIGKSLFDSEESNEPVRFRSVNIGSEEGKGIDDDLFGRKREGAKRGLDFEDIVDVFGGNEERDSEEIREENVDLKMEKLEKKRSIDDEDYKGDEDSKKKTKKKKRIEDNVKKPAVNKPKEEKEMRVQRQQLHVETQRVLRETRDVGFRPSPIVHKPISSVLEKIRQRKLEVLKRTMLMNNSSEELGALRDSVVCVEEMEAPKSSEAVDDELVENSVDVEGNLDASPVGIPRETTTQKSNEEVLARKELDVEPTPPLRAPVDDTQDLFDDSQVSSGKDELLDGQSDSPLEEPFAPSLLAMNLEFDSALPDDSSSSSDDEDDEKENIRPGLQEDCASPKGDPVRAFIDEEAEDDDSDNDINCLRENDEDDMDAEELNDIIATDYKERPADKERRDELHQKWLEQQDAAGTDNLLQRIKYGSKRKKPTIVDEEHTDSEDDEEFSNEFQDAAPRDDARMNLKKAKQRMVQMFVDKDDVCLSDEEEESVKILEKQRILRSEERITLISPAEDESSREVFGLIKKLNIAPDQKRKPKPASNWETVLGESSNSSSRSSFLGRVSDPLPSSKGQRSTGTRPYVFGRDDSNSRSSMLTAEDSTDAVPKEIKSSKKTTAKFTSSQVINSQSSSSSTGGKAAGASLFDILKKSTILSGVKPNEISMSGFSGSVLDAFKIPRRPVRTEARGL